MSVCYLQQCSLVWKVLEHWLAHNPTLHPGLLKFLFVSLFLAEHVWHQILFRSSGRFVLMSTMFNWLVDSACQTCHVAWGPGTFPTSCFQSLISAHVSSVWLFWTTVGRNDKIVEDCEVMKVEIWVLCPFLGLSADRLRVCYAVSFVHVPSVSITVVCIMASFRTFPCSS